MIHEFDAGIVADAAAVAAVKFVQRELGGEGGVPFRAFGVAEQRHRVQIEPRPPHVETRPRVFGDQLFHAVEGVLPADQIFRRVEFFPHHPRIVVVDEESGILLAEPVGLPEIFHDLRRRLAVDGVAELLYRRFDVDADILGHAGLQVDVELLERGAVADASSLFGDQIADAVFVR